MYLSVSVICYAGMVFPLFSILTYGLFGHQVKQVRDFHLGAAKLRYRPVAKRLLGVAHEDSTLNGDQLVDRRLARKNVSRFLLKL
jgi:hypothetical protein